MSEFDHNDNDTNNRTTSHVNLDTAKETTFSPSLIVTKTELHPALLVSNIKNHIHIVLEMEKYQYGTKVELFCIHVCSHWVLHHIVPSTDKTTGRYLSCRV